MRIRMVCKEWVGSDLRHIDDDGEEHDVLPRETFFDGAIFLEQEDEDRLLYWLEKGFYPLMLINRA